MAESAEARGDLAVIKTETMDGGIRLEVMDASRPLVGDRWRVAAVFRLVIPVDAALAAGGATAPDPGRIRSLIGDPVVFEKRLERTFIDAGQKEEILQDMVRRYLDGARGYISRPVFARNYILKRYGEALKKGRWYADNSDGSPPPPERAAV